MRYVVIVVTFRFEIPIQTDFRLIAYIMAFFKSITCREVYIFDNDMDNYIYSYGPVTGKNN